MKFIISLATILICVCSCNKRDIKRVIISYYKADKSLDSATINTKEEKSIMEEYISNKIETSEKFPSVYFLEVQYENGSIEKYSGNGYFLRADKVYINLDSTLQKRYLRVINSKLPAYLKQE